MKNYNQNGQTSNYPASCEDYGWCVETDLDIEMVAAACPKCTVYLMEAWILDLPTLKLLRQKPSSWAPRCSAIAGSAMADRRLQRLKLSKYFDTAGIAYLAAVR